MKRDHSSKPRQRPNRHVRSVVDALLSIDRRLSSVEKKLGALPGKRRIVSHTKDWYTTSEVAEALGVTVYTVAVRWCSRNRIECVKDPRTGRWRIPGHEFRRLTRGGGYDAGGRG